MKVSNSNTIRRHISLPLSNLRPQSKDLKSTTETPNDRHDSNPFKRLEYGTKELDILHHYHEGSVTSIDISHLSKYISQNLVTTMDLL